MITTGKLRLICIIFEVRKKYIKITKRNTRYISEKKKKKKVSFSSEIFNKV